MRKKMITADEEISGVVPLICFNILWYVSCAGIILRGSGFSTVSALFVVAGLLPVYAVFQKVRRALYYRRLRRRTIGEGRKSRGRIINIVKRTETVAGSRQRTHMRRLYFLIVEITNSDNGAVYQIESDAYSFPVDSFLASPEVTVYTDKSGWKHYIEDFRLKASRKDPGIFPDRPEFKESTAVYKIFEIVIILLMLWTILGQFFR